MNKVESYLQETWPGFVVFAAVLGLSVTCAAWAPTAHYAYDGEAINAGDTAWMIVSTALVLLMTPGLAFFYGGMVQSKNLITTLTQSYAAIMLISVLWVVVLFSLCFGEDVNGAGIIGNPATFAFFKDVGGAPNDDFADNIPFSLFSMFQLKFAIITPALISGAISERVNFKAYLLFITLFAIFIYSPICHMTWGPNGILGEWGVIDFAGGTVVHMSSGYAALAGAYYLGASKVHRERRPVQPANIPFMMLGTALLLFGWYGFNAGSALGANQDAAQAFVNTHVAAATGMMGWMFMDYFRLRHLSASGLCIGCVVGLVGITPAAGFVTTGGALLIGLISSIVANIIAHLMKASEIDDTLDVFSCHGVGGSIGLLLTGLLANVEVSNVEGEDGALDTEFNGAFYGNPTLFGKCLATVCIMGPIFFVGSLILFKITDLIIPLRVTEEVEKIGLDASHHGETLPGIELPGKKTSDISNENVSVSISQ